MRRISKKRAARIREASEFRKSLLASFHSCMICGQSPKNSANPGNRLCVHEIANGPLREAALDKPYACMVLCWRCNSEVVIDKKGWPQARQLATLKLCAPGHYDLAAFNFLVNPRAPNRITEDEVRSWSGHEKL